MIVSNIDTNLATVFGEGSGGGMFNRGSSRTLTNVIITDKIATCAGGGMYNHDDSNPMLRDVRLLHRFTGEPQPPSG